MTKRAPWWDRLNAALVPKIGPPPLGPYNQEPLPPSSGQPCPLCRKPMGEHTFERGDAHTSTRMHCPR